LFLLLTGGTKPDEGLTKEISDLKQTIADMQKQQTLAIFCERKSA